MRKFDEKFDVRWIDIKTDEWGKTETVKGGDIVKFVQPGRRHLVAAIVKGK